MASLAEIQGQQVRQHEQMLALTTEISELNKKVPALHQDALKKDATIEGQTREIMYLKSSGGQQQRDHDVSMKDMGNLINTKSMSPKVFHGKAEESYKTWAKKVRAFCNANRPVFKKFVATTRRSSLKAWRNVGVSPSV